MDGGKWLIFDGWVCGFFGGGWQGAAGPLILRWRGEVRSSKDPGCGAARSRPSRVAALPPQGEGSCCGRREELSEER